MYRVSVTTIEKFRRYMADVSAFDTEEAFLETLKGIFIGTPKTAFGSAYHKIIECGHLLAARNGDWCGYMADGFFFTNSQAEPALKYRDEHMAMVHEMNVRKIYDTNYFPIQVTGRVDGVEGLAVRDAKTKFRSPDWEEYMDSCQWKFYLDMLETNVFYYDLFEIKGFNEETYTTQKLFPEVKVEAHEPLQCVRYDDMEADITTLLNTFLEYMTAKNLFQHLKPAMRDERLFG